MSLTRPLDQAELRKRIGYFPATAILGPRQCGKTTLARELGGDHFYDLENPRDLSAFESAQTLLESLAGLIVIDEVQRKPDLFPVLRHLIDTRPQAKYLLLGSASPDLVRASSESLAGRIAYYPLGGFRISEVGDESWRSLWLRGGFPRSYLAPDDATSAMWRESYVTTFLEHDIPALGIRVPALTLRRFWTMLSHVHGQILSYSELGRSMEASDTAVRHHLDILEGTYMVRLLRPWFTNTSKRLVKSPKVYLRDSGLFHFLQGIPSMSALHAHPKLGASWEGFALEQTAQRLPPGQELFFWGTQAGGELDLLWEKDGKMYGCEFKFSDAPRRTRSMTTAMEDLKLEHLWVVYPGDREYPLGDKITATPLWMFPVSRG